MMKAVRSIYAYRMRLCRIFMDWAMQVDDSETVETLSKILEFESSIVPSDQELWHNNRMLQKRYNFRFGAMEPPG